MTVSAGRQWAVLVPLLAGVVFAWPTYVRYFGVHPGPMVAALCIAFVILFAPNWVIVGPLEEVAKLLPLLLLVWLAPRVVNLMRDGIVYWA